MNVRQGHYKFKVVPGKGEHEGYGTIREIDVAVLHKVASHVFAILKPIWCEDCRAYHLSRDGSGMLTMDEANIGTNSGTHLPGAHGGAKTNPVRRL